MTFPIKNRKKSADKGENMKRRGSGEGHVSKQPNGTYFAQIYIDGKRPSKRFSTQREAQKWLTSIKDAANKGRYVDPSMMPLSDYWDKWISVDKAHSVGEATKQTYAYSRARLPVSLFDLPISKITRQDIQEALNTLTGKGLKRRTVEMSRTALNMCFNQAVDDGLIMGNPVRRTTLPAAERRKKKAYPHSIEDELIRYCLSSPRITASGDFWHVDVVAQVYKDAALTILRTGIRRDECCSRIWSDWEGSKLLIRGTKNDASVDYVPLTQDVVDILKRRHKEATSIYIFEKDGKPILGNSLYHHLKKKFGYSVHGLRHTLGRDAMEAGVNPRIVQKILRHADLRTTLEIYTDISDEDTAAAVTKIAARCNSDVMASKIKAE